MDLQLNGKRAIVTGGSAGIGLAVVRALAEEGATVTVPGRSLKKVEAALTGISPELGKAGQRGKLTAIEADLGTAAGAATLVEQVPETDILVNNLGIYDWKSFSNITDEEWFHYFEVNLLGGIRLSRHYFPRMLERNWGRVIFVSSEAGAETHPDMIHYGVTKTGQLAVSRGLAEMTKGTNVTVNTVLPGPTRAEATDAYLMRTASTPNATPAEAEREYFQRKQPTSLLQRMAEGDEVASLVAYLASPKAVATNGAAIRAEGGILRGIL